MISADFVRKAPTDVLARTSGFFLVGRSTAAVPPQFEDHTLLSAGNVFMCSTKGIAVVSAAATVDWVLTLLPVQYCLVLAQGHEEP